MAGRRVRPLGKSRAEILGWFLVEGFLAGGVRGSKCVAIETGELACAQFVVNFHAGVDFFSAGPVGFETNAGLEQFDLGWIFRCLNGGAFLLLFIGRLLLWFLRGVLPLSDVLLRY